MRVHTLPQGTLGIPMPEQIKGDLNRRLPGGEPPVPYRSRNDWGTAGKMARSDGTSMACRMECLHSTSEWNQSAKGGRGRWVPA